MTLSPFTPDELAAWIDAKLDEPVPVASYEPKPGEMTVKSYLQILRSRGEDVTRKTAYDRLRKMVARGFMTVRQETVARYRTNVYTMVRGTEGDGDGE